MSTDYEIAMQIMNTIIPFGSYKGKRIGEMTRYNMKYYNCRYKRYIIIKCLHLELKI